MFNEGISYEGDVLDVATDAEVVKKAGAFYSFGEIKLGQGRENSKKFLKENPEITEKIVEALK
jgi:recombination protein RecA